MAEKINFRLNYKQTWKLVHIQKYCEEESVVIDAASYDAEERSFTFACMVKDEAPDAVWENLQTNDQGWAFFQMDAEGECYQLDPEDV